MRFAVAKQQGLTEERVALVDEDFEVSELSEAEKSVIRFTDVMLDGGQAMTEEMRTELLVLFDAGQIVELAVGIALFMGFSKIAISLGQAPADMPTMVVPTPDWPIP